MKYIWIDECKHITEEDLMVILERNKRMSDDQFTIPADKFHLYKAAPDLYDVCMQTVKLIEDEIIVCRSMDRLGQFTKFMSDLQMAIVKAQGGHRGGTDNHTGL